MFGGDVPDLETTPCPACGETVAAAEVVWDPYHREDRRLAAMPYHRRCAGDLLPPDEPSEDMKRCAICEEALAGPELADAFAALRARFTQPKAAVATPHIVWRLAGREPRVFLAEHFQCLLGTVKG